MAHDKQTKQKALEMLRNFHPAYVSDTLGVPRRTVYNWFCEVKAAERERLRTEQASRRDLYLLISSTYSKMLLDPETLKDASPRDAAVIFGILQDKLFKLDRIDPVEFTEEHTHHMFRARDHEESRDGIKNDLDSAKSMMRSMEEDYRNEMLRVRNEEKAMINEELRMKSEE